MALNTSLPIKIPNGTNNDGRIFLSDTPPTFINSCDIGINVDMENELFLLLYNWIKYRNNENKERKKFPE